MREALLWEAFFSLSDKSLLGRVSRRPAKSRFKSPAHFNSNLSFFFQVKAGKLYQHVVQLFVDIHSVFLKNQGGEFQVGNLRVIRRKKGRVYLQ